MLFVEKSAYFMLPFKAVKQTSIAATRHHTRPSTFEHGQTQCCTSMSKKEEFNYAPSEQSRSYDMLLPGIGTRYHRFETEQPVSTTHSKFRQASTKSASARPLHVVDEPIERRELETNHVERENVARPSLKMTPPPTKLQRPLRQTHQTEPSPDTRDFENHTQSPIRPPDASKPLSTHNVWQSGNTTDNAQVTRQDEQQRDAREQTKKNPQKQDEPNRTAVASTLNWSQQPRVHFADDNHSDRQAHRRAIEENDEYEETGGGEQEAEDEEEEEGEDRKGSERTTENDIWLSARMPPKETEREKILAPAKKRSIFSSLTSAQKKTIVSVVQFIVTTIAVFVLLLVLNPPFVQQQASKSASGLEANTVSFYSVQPTDLSKALVYSAIGGALAAALPYAWEFFVGIAPGGTKKKKPPVRRYRRKKRAKTD